jgi:hypothetical protein
MRREKLPTALLTTSVMRSCEGAGAAWKMKGKNSEAWHIRTNCAVPRDHFCRNTIAPR